MIVRFDIISYVNDSFCEQRELIKREMYVWYNIRNLLIIKENI